MLLHQKNKPQPVELPATLPPAAAVEEPEGFTYSGTGIIQSGVYAVETFSDDVRELVQKLDTSKLVLNDNYGKVIEEIQKEILANIATKEIDMEAIPVKKINSLAELSVEDRKLLASFLGEQKLKYEANQEAQRRENEPTMSFDSPAELFKHVGQKLHAANAPQAIKNEAENAVKIEHTTGAETATVAAVAPQVTAKSQPVIASAGEPPSAPPSELAPFAKFGNCPHCNIPLSVDPAEVTAEHKKQFLYSVIHGQPYEETIYLFNDAVKLKVRALNTAEADYLEAVIDKVSLRPELSTKEKFDFYLRAYLAFSIINLDIGKRQYSYSPLNLNGTVDEAVDLVVARCQALVEAVENAELLKLLCSETTKMQFRHKRLVALGLDADFWKPIQQ